MIIQRIFKIKSITFPPTQNQVNQLNVTEVVHLRLVGWKEQF